MNQKITDIAQFVAEVFVVLAKENTLKEFLQENHTKDLLIRKVYTMYLQMLTEKNKAIQLEVDQLDTEVSITKDQINRLNANTTEQTLTGLQEEIDSNQKYLQSLREDSAETVQIITNLTTALLSNQPDIPKQWDVREPLYVYLNKALSTMAAVVQTSNTQLTQVINLDKLSAQHIEQLKVKQISWYKGRLATLEENRAELDSIRAQIKDNQSKVSEILDKLKDTSSIE